MSISITQFNHLRIPLDEIQNATNNFSENNKIGRDDFGYIYEGQLLRSGELINFSARRLDRSQGLGDIEFLTEVSVLSSLNHPNVVFLIGFCDENGEKIIINSSQAKGNLSMYLDDPALGWFKRLRIAIGVADAIRYIHYEEGRNYSIIHRNINSSTILLDENFEAKLSGFEYSIKDSMDRTERFIPSEVINIQGYVDPKTIKSGYVTQRSDIYSFGAVLCDIMCGRKSFLPHESDDNKFLAPLVKIHYANNTLEDILIPDMWNGMDPESCKEFVATVLRMLETDRELPLDMNTLLVYLNDRWDIQLRTEFYKILEAVLVRRAEPTALSHQEIPTTAENDVDDDWDVSSDIVISSVLPAPEVIESTPSNAWKVDKLEHLRIGFIHIQLATNNFSKESTLNLSHSSYGTIFSGDLEWFGDTHGNVYKGDLEWFDRKSGSSLEGKSEGELPKRRYNVRIMRETEVDRFHKEIEILSTCKNDNIDSLLGFCDEGSHMILVYEGNTYNRLEEYLGSQVLTWDMRLKICLDVAHGLNYIHNEMEDQKMIIHRQVSSQCIMLDNNLQGTKITGFGLSTFGDNQDEDALDLRKNYLHKCSLYSRAPEVSDTGKATKESDIYSFGVVMFEILCGIDYVSLSLLDAEFRAEHWFMDRTIKQKVARVVREENRGNKLFLKEGPNEDSLDTFIKITEQCLAVNPEQRPTLQVIIMELRNALTFQA
ncbi:protein kinase-like domain, concanavalin A-like lectin/glucanase domain protein, partial [Tanacetum coccineum]